MAKTTEKLAAEQSPAADLLLKFRDKVFTSRTLCIPGTERTLSVVQAAVAVSASDEQAVSFLRSHPELEVLE